MRLGWRQPKCRRLPSSSLLGDNIHSTAEPPRPYGLGAHLHAKQRDTLCRAPQYRDRLRPWDTDCGSQRENTRALRLRGGSRARPGYPAAREPGGDRRGITRTGAVVTACPDRTRERSGVTLAHSGRYPNR